MLTHLVNNLTSSRWLIDCFPQKKSDHNSIVVIKLDLIGDYVIWLNAAQHLRKVFPDKTITLYANSLWADLAKKTEYWNKVIAVDVDRLRKDTVYQLKIFFKIHYQNFDLAIQPTYSREYAGDMLLRASGAKSRIGFRGDLGNILIENKLISDTWYTQLIESTSGVQMELQRNIDFINSLSNNKFLSGLPHISITHELKPEFKFQTPYIVLVPGASWYGKRWEDEKFTELINRIVEKYKVETIVLCGTVNENDLCTSIFNQTNSAVVNLAGKTSLIEMIEIIRNAELVVSNDSSAVHIATATKTHSVCILGGGHYGRFLPYASDQNDMEFAPHTVIKKMDCYGCNWSCIYKTDEQKPVPCIAEIDVDDVFKVCSETISLSIR